MKSLFLIVVLALTTTISFAQESNLEDRLSNLEDKMQNMGAYVEENCELVLDYTAGGLNACYGNSVMSGITINAYPIGNGQTNVMHRVDCKRYRLVCRD